MKQLRTKLADKLTYQHFLTAHQRASKGKNFRSEVLAFNLNQTVNLLHIMDVVASGNYHPSTYRKFWVNDPKRRQILALPYQDRIVHQWAAEEFYKPYYLPRFIADSYACIPGRGTHSAVDRVEQFMRRMHYRYDNNYYIMKMDVAGFFANIDQQILFDIAKRAIADRRLLDLTHTFIFDGDDHDGIPIGNYTSQLFANIYLNELDQFVKNDLRIRFYVRYMDDFVLLVPGKATASLLYGIIEQFLWQRLHLRLNAKSRYYPASLGLDFAGYRLYGDYRLLRQRSKRKLRAIIKDYERGVDSAERFIARANAWYGHAAHADSYRYAHRHLAKYTALLPAVFDAR